MNGDRGDPELRAILRAQGFADSQQWVEYAARKGMRVVPAQRLQGCPGCESLERDLIGQYVYYSNLVQFTECGGCGLIYADTRISPAVIRNHFETAYKDEGYFVQRRRGIFGQIAELADRHLPHQGSVLDVGGATGHLMNALRARRPDIRVTVNDISTDACAAARTLGFDSVPGSIADLASLDRAFDVVVMSDVIYYEPNVAGLWEAARRLVARNGTLILRVPNRVRLIKWASKLQALVATVTGKLHDRLPFFNPEHLFAYSRRFLAGRLRQAAFSDIRFLPSRLLHGPTGRSPAMAAWELAASAAHAISFHQLVLTPSLLVVATRRDSRE